MKRSKLGGNVSAGAGFGRRFDLRSLAADLGAGEHLSTLERRGPRHRRNQTGDQKLQKLVTDLNALIKKAETANAADPNFIADLKKTVGGLSSDRSSRVAAGRTGSRLPVRTIFADGNYTANPVWKVSAGTWRVDTKGATVGLSSAIGQAASNKVSGNDVLKAILGVQQQEEPQSTYASIYTAVPMSNTFKATVKFVSGNTNGPLNIGPLSGRCGLQLLSPGLSAGQRDRLGAAARGRQQGDPGRRL